MGLDFTTIKDRHGSAIYFIHDGSDKDRIHFEKLAEEIEHRTKKQTVVMSKDEKNAMDIIKFYQLKGTHFVLIVRDDDQLHHYWSNGDHFDASHIAFLANQVG